MRSPIAEERKNLRKAGKCAFLEKGITVARTADDLVRYHGKMMVVDAKSLPADVQLHPPGHGEKAALFGCDQETASLVGVDRSSDVTRKRPVRTNPVPAVSGKPQSTRGQALEVLSGSQAGTADL